MRTTMFSVALTVILAGALADITVSPDGKFLFFQRNVDGNTDICWDDAKVIREMK